MLDQTNPTMLLVCVNVKSRQSKTKQVEKNVYTMNTRVASLLLSREMALVTTDLSFL